MVVGITVYADNRSTNSCGQSVDNTAHALVHTRGDDLYVLVSICSCCSLPSSIGDNGVRGAAVVTAGPPTVVADVDDPAASSSRDSIAVI